MCRPAVGWLIVIAALPMRRIVHCMTRLQLEVEVALSRAHAAAGERLRRGEPCPLIVLFHLEAPRADPIVVCPRATSEADFAALAESAPGIARGYGASAVTLGLIGRLGSVAAGQTQQLQPRPASPSCLNSAARLLLLHHERPGATMRAAYAVRPDGPSAERIELDGFSGADSRFVIGDTHAFAIALARLDAIRVYADASQLASVAQL